MDIRLSREMALRVRRVDAPLETVVRGAGRCIENLGMDFSVFGDDYE